MLKIIKNFTLNTLFPISCLACGQADVWLCQKCLAKIVVLPFQVCPYCEKIETPAGAICLRCKARLLRKDSLIPLDNLVIATSYKHHDIPRLVHTFKYNFVPDLGHPLAQLIAKAILNNHLPLPDFIIPVPLHPRRARWRGFNQAEILARNLSSDLSLGLPIPVLTDTVIRKKFTPPQMNIKNYGERKKNMQNSFALSKSVSTDNLSLRNKKILLIDDISTTGSTLLECAKVLKAAGAKKVYGAVIARQEIP
ncbi:MAG: ComF family protein [Parcubacteria group bacterium]